MRRHAVPKVGGLPRRVGGLRVRKLEGPVRTDALDCSVPHRQTAARGNALTASLLTQRPKCGERVGH